jgi:hypothetical protein
MTKIDDLRPFLEKWTKQSLTGRQHLGMYVEALAAAELKDILELVKECKAVSVIFDGTTRVDEVLAVVFRFVKEDFSIVQKLVSLAKYKDVKNHEKLAWAVLAVLAANGIPYATGVVGWQRDRAAVNGAAMTYLTQSYGGLDMKCLSHTITHVGEHMETELLETWINDLCAMMSQGGGSNKATTAWQEVMGRCWRHPGNTLWWSKFEVSIYLHTNMKVVYLLPQI